MDDAQENIVNLKEVFEVVSNSSLIDFLNNEENCEEKIDEVQLFSEINRLATLNNSKFNENDDDRTIEELLKEAETLINQPIGVDIGDCTISCQSTPLEIKNGLLDQYDYSTVKTLSHPDVSFLLSTFLSFGHCTCDDLYERH